MAFSVAMYAGAASAAHAARGGGYTSPPQRHSRRQSQSTSPEPRSPLARSPQLGASRSPVFHSRGESVGDGDLDDIPPLEYKPSQVSIYDRVPLVTKTAVRLARIHPGKDGPIECTLTSFSLGHPPDFIEDPPNFGKPPEFVALAYSWPPPKRLHHQGVAGHHSVIFYGRSLPITDHLNRFLVAWRDRTDASLPEWIWIDDICLNRPDRHEKNNSLLREIYKRAKFVIEWPEDGTARGFEVHQTGGLD